MANDVVGDVHALVRDLLPILVPGATFDVSAGTVLLPISGGRARVSTEPLIAECRKQPQHAWPRAVDAWLTGVRGQITDAVTRDEPVSVDRLRIQVTPRHGEEQLVGLVALPFGGHFDVVAVVDRPDRVDRLTVAQAAALGLDTERAIERAIHQTITNELRDLDIHDRRVGPATLRLVARDNSRYVTAALLSVGRFLPGAAPYGALVAAPRYSGVILHHVETASAVDTIVVLARLAKQMYASAPDGCTDRVFWWADGVLHRLTVEEGDDPTRPRVALPADIATLVDRLPAA